MEVKYIVHVDGSCLNLGSEDSMGGWGFVVINNETKEIIVEKNGKLTPGLKSIAKAELEALYQALFWIDANNIKERFHVYTDHETIVGSLEGDYKRTANRGYWDLIEPLCHKFVGQLSISHIKSHVYNTEDENSNNHNYCDKLAKKGANSLLLKAINERE